MQGRWLTDEHLIMDCFYEAKQPLGLPQILGCYERKTGGVPSDLGTVLASLVGKGFLEGPHGRLQTYRLTDAGRRMDTRERLQERFQFIETLYEYGTRAAVDQEEIGQKLGWNPQTTDDVVTWLSGEKMVECYVGGEVTLTHPGRVWAEEKSLSAARAAVAGGPTVAQHFQGTVGAVLTGDHARATVTQHVGSDDQKVAVAALLMLRDLLSGLESLPKDLDSEKVIELVDQVREEVVKNPRDVGRMAKIAGAIATGIQTAGSLKGAWEAVKAGLTMLGVNLP